MNRGYSLPLSGYINARGKSVGAGGVATSLTQWHVVSSSDVCSASSTSAGVQAACVIWFAWFRCVRLCLSFFCDMTDSATQDFLRRCTWRGVPGLRECSLRRSVALARTAHPECRGVLAATLCMCIHLELTLFRDDSQRERLFVLGHVQKVTVYRSYMWTAPCQDNSSPRSLQLDPAIHSAPSANVVL